MINEGYGQGIEDSQAFRERIYPTLVRLTSENLAKGLNNYTRNPEPEERSNPAKDKNTISLHVLTPEMWEFGHENMPHCLNQARFNPLYDGVLRISPTGMNMAEYDHAINNGHKICTKCSADPERNHHCTMFIPLPIPRKEDPSSYLG